jgi:hypothetical protein
MKVGSMGNYKVNDRPEANFPARATWVNEDGTVDLMVMIHAEDYPEFSREECASGHAHRLGIKVGTGNGEFLPDTTSAWSGVDVRVDALIQRVAALEESVFSMETKTLKLSNPPAN